MPPIPRLGNTFDFLDEYRRLTDRVRRLELDQQGGAGQVESFIMDPITVRAWPAACACSMRITGVLAYIGSGTADITFWFVQPASLTPDPIALHTFSGASSGTVLSALETDMDFGDVVDLDIGDFYYPEITDGSGNNITAGYITSPGH